MAGSSLLGQLLVRASIDTTQFSKGVASLKSLCGTAIDSMGGLASSLSGMVTPMRAAGAAIAAAIGAGFRGLDALDKLSFDASKIGVGVQSLAELQHSAAMADVEASALQGSLQKMVKEIGAMQLGGNADELQKLGLSLEDLKGKAATEQFAILADALRGVTDTNEQAAIGAKIFGKSFAEIKPLVDGGAEAIRAAAAEARAFGQVLSEDQTARANEANIAWDRFKEATDGATKSVAASLAPAFEGFYEIGISLLTDVLKPFLPLLTVIGHVVGITAKIIATAFSGIAMVVNATVSVFLMAAGIFSSSARTMSAEWEQAAADSAANMKKIWSDTAAGEEQIKQTTAAAQELKQTISYGLWDSFVDGAKKATSTVKEVFNQLYEHNKKVKDLIADYQKQIRQFGMTAREKQIDDLGATNGVSFTDDQRKQLELLNAQITALEAQKKQQEELARLEQERIKEGERAEQQRADRIKQLLEDAKTEEEKLAERWKEIVDAFMSGAINGDEYGSLARKYFEDQKTLEDRNKNEANKNAPTWESFTAGPAMFAGSQAAQDAILRGMYKGGGKDPIDDVAKNTNATVQEGKKQTAELKRLNARLRFKVVK